MAVAASQIIELVRLRLANISTSNGYYTKPGKIELARLKPFTGYDLPAINFWATRLSVSEKMYRKQKRSLTLFVEMHDMTRDRAFVTVCDELASDIVHGLNRTPAAPKISDTVSRDLGGVVSDFDFIGYDYQIGEGQAPWCGVLCEFGIKYISGDTDMSSFSA